jgi:3-methyladenine DNA glycosylase AlkD
MVVTLDVQAELSAIRSALASRRDSGYEAGMRRTVPSGQPAHAARVPDIRKTASEWRRGHKDVAPPELFELCDALWQSGWREERLVAITLVGANKEARTAANWERLERWSQGIDNWEQVDHLADVTGHLLIADRSLLPHVKALEASDNPWQRRLALVTLIVAFCKGAVFQEELSAMADRRKTDKHPLVRKAVVWARDRLKKDHLDG